MAKKPSYGKKRGNGKAFTLNVTNLKFIGCAFDEAISDLEAIRTNAIDKAQVDTARQNDGAGQAAIRAILSRARDRRLLAG